LDEKKLKIIVATLPQRWQVLVMKTNYSELKTSTLIHMIADKKGDCDAIMNEISERMSFEDFEILLNRVQINNFINR
jgi:hypothetical protein